MSRFKRRKAALAVVAVVVVVLVGSGLLLTGMASSPARTPRMSKNWSKGLPLGMASLNNRIAFVVDETGNVYVVWVNMERSLHFVRLNEQAQVIVDGALDLAVSWPRQPQLALDSDEQLHLTWLGRQGEELHAYYARFSADGEVLQGATILSETGLRSGRMAMALESIGRTVEVFWSDDAAGRPGVYHAALDWEGNVVAPEKLLIPEGLRPSAQVDHQGIVHLGWRVETLLERPKFHYALYDPQRRLLGPDIQVQEPHALDRTIGGRYIGATYGGPWLGLDEHSVYIAWLLEIHHRASRSSYTFYQMFPQPVLVGDSDTLDYRLDETVGDGVGVQAEDSDLEGGLRYLRGEFVWVRDQAPRLTGDPKFVDGQPERQMLACYAQAIGPGDLEMFQIVALDLAVEQTGKQEVVSATRGASRNPSVALDGQGNAHLVWVDTAGFNQYQVIYASTAPRVQEALNPATASEIVDRVLDAGFRAFAALIFLPLYLLWAVPAFLLLLGFHLTNHEVDLSQRRAVVALCVAIVIHIVVKSWAIGSFLEQMNVGALLVWPGFMSVVRWLLLPAISGLAVIVMLVYIRRTGTQSLFTGFFIFLLADVALFFVVCAVPLILMGSFDIHAIEGMMREGFNPPQ